MKKYIILLLIAMPLSMWGQTSVNVKSDTTKKEVKKKPKKIRAKRTKKAKIEPQPIVYVNKPIVKSIAKSIDDLNLVIMLDSNKIRKRVFDRDSLVHVYKFLPNGIRRQEFSGDDTLAKSKSYIVIEIEESVYVDSVYRQMIVKRKETDDENYKQLKRRREEAEKKEKEYLETLKNN